MVVELLIPKSFNGRFVNGSSGQYGQLICPAVISHPIYGPSTIGSRPCTPDDDGDGGWTFDAGAGTIRRIFPNSSQLAGGCLEMTYSIDKSTNFVLFAQNCSSTGNQGQVEREEQGGSGGERGGENAGVTGNFSNRFALIRSSSNGDPLPEGGHYMLQAVDMSNKTSPGGSDSKWIRDGGCVAVVEANLNITMGIASWLYDEHDHPIPATGGHLDAGCDGHGDGEGDGGEGDGDGGDGSDCGRGGGHRSSNLLSSSVDFMLYPGREYVLKTSAQTNRPPTAAMQVG